MKCLNKVYPTAQLFSDETIADMQKQINQMQEDIDHIRGFLVI